MSHHKNARSTDHGREPLVRRILHEGLRPREAAQAMGVSPRTACTWLRRERQRCHQIGQRLGIGQSTVARLLRRHGLNRLSRLEPARPMQRCEYPQPGGLLHLDIKKLGRFHRPGHRVTGDRQHDSRGAGWEYVHVAIDDHSRVAFSTILPDERGASACRFLLQALRYYRSLGIRFQRLLTDNGACYKSRRFRRLCRRLHLKHKRTNGKAERFIQASLGEWAYARAYDSSEQRARHLLPWLHAYNGHRPHAASATYLPSAAYPP